MRQKQGRHACALRFSRVPGQAAWVPALTGDIAFTITLIVPLTIQAGVLLMFSEGGRLVNSHWAKLVVRNELLCKKNFLFDG